MSLHKIVAGLNIVANRQWPLYPPKGMDVEDYYDWLYERDVAIASSFPILWDKKYQEEFITSIRILIQRAKESNKNSDIILTLKRAEPDTVHLRGDYRYPSDDLAEYIKQGKDLLPSIVGKTSSGSHLLDGHHRWRAYLLAGKKPLILEASFEKTSKTPVIKTVVSL